MRSKSEDYSEIYGRNARQYTRNPSWQLIQRISATHRIDKNGEKFNEEFQSAKTVTYSSMRWQRKLNQRIAMSRKWFCHFKFAAGRKLLIHGPSRGPAWWFDVHTQFFPKFILRMWLCRSTVGCSWVGCRAIGACAPGQYIHCLAAGGLGPTDRPPLTLAILNRSHGYPDASNSDAWVNAWVTRCLSPARSLDSAAQSPPTQARPWSLGGHGHGRLRLTVKLIWPVSYDSPSRSWWTHFYKAEIPRSFMTTPRLFGNMINICNSATWTKWPGRRLF